MKIEADTAHAIAVLECKHYSFSIFCLDGVVVVDVIDDEREWRGMLQHFCYWPVMFTNKGKTEVVC